MCNTDETPESYFKSELDTQLSNEASYYFVRHPEMAYSVELWFHVRDWLIGALGIDNDYHPYIDINMVDDCIDYWLKQPQYSHFKKQALMKARKKQIEQDFT